MHELAHIKGADEEEAVFLQNAFYGLAVGWENGSTVRDHYRDLSQSDVSKAEGPLLWKQKVSELQASLESSADGCRTGENFFQAFNEFLTSNWKYNISRALRARELANLRMASHTNNLLRSYACATDKTANEEVVAKAREQFKLDSEAVNSDENQPKCSSIYKVARFKPTAFITAAEAMVQLKLMNVMVVDTFEQQRQLGIKEIPIVLNENAR